MVIKGKSRTIQAAGSKSPKAPRQGLLARQSEENLRGDVSSDLQDDGRGDDNQLVAAVVRAIGVLNAFKAGEAALGNTELAQRTGLTKPTVSRLAYTLVRCGYLSFNPRYRVYELGPSALALGHVARSSMSVRQVARPLMESLARQANFNVGLGTRENDSMVYTDTCEGTALVGLRLFAGSRIPMVSSAMGRAYLAGLGTQERDSVFADLRKVNGANWPAIEKSLMRAIADVERVGFCLSAGEWQQDIHGVGAPIRDPAGGPAYALNLGGPAYLLPTRLLKEELGPRLAQVARDIEKQLSPGPTSVPVISTGEQDLR
jgi:DNA-binding IclR family transcriptional regulator